MRCQRSQGTWPVSNILVRDKPSPPCGMFITGSISDAGEGTLKAREIRVWADRRTHWAGRAPVWLRESMESLPLIPVSTGSTQA